VHACDFDTVIPVVVYSKIKGIPFFYTIYDYYAANIPNDYGRVKKIVAFLEDRMIEQAECVFLVDDCRLNQIASCHLRDYAIINNSPDDISLAKSNVSDQFVLFYAGALLNVRGISSIISAASKIQDIKIIIAGSGPEEKRIKDAHKTNGNVLFLGQIPYDMVIKQSEQASALIALYDPYIENNIYASPNKLFEAMMLAKPIIASNNPSIQKIINSEKCGIVIEYGNLEELIGAISLLKYSPDIRKTLGENGRKAYVEKYSWNIMKKRIVTKYASVLKGQSGEHG
jgi:glycosyltransferase involved in cell wall biosynthesis